MTFTRRSRALTNRPPRPRARRDEMEERATAIFDIVEDIQPCTVRQVFYQATVRGVVAKTERDYKKVGRMLTEMRLADRLPWRWITDHTRYRSKPDTYDSIDSALRSTAEFYRRALWRDIDTYVEIWLEKDALRGVLWPITNEYDVPLMVARGYASLSFLYASAEEITDTAKPTYIYHFGDFDPSGLDAARNVELRLREFAPRAEIHFERVAVTRGQIAVWDLPTRPTKDTDTRTRKFVEEGGTDSVELDAINPNDLRNLVRRVLTEHMPEEQLRVLKVAEESERELALAWLNRADFTKPPGRRRHK